MSEGLHRKLTLVSAPAGFGKTTLVTEWLDNLSLYLEKDSQIKNRVAWLSLDEGDNDPVRFLTYFIAALNQVEGKDASLGKGALSILQSPQPPPSDVILTSLINEFVEITAKIVFVLDDYHLVENQPIQDSISFLLEHLPSQLHLVIITREDPSLPLARLRVRSQLTELRAADLRFNSSEVAEFLNQVMGLNLSADDITALETRTEGWIAGLQLAAISIQGREDVSNLIKSFAGNHRLVLDYLIEEVLNQQPESIQSFLLQTAVLDRLTGSLCDVLTGQDNGQETLEKLDRANLFIIPLDDERHWYRYHHLFVDLLRQRLRRTLSNQLSLLHHRASEWYEQNGFNDEAIEHALRAEGFEQAVRLIEEQADVIWGRGEHTKLERWLDRLPADLICSKPHLCIIHAWTLFTNGQQDAAEETLQAAEQALEANTDHLIEKTKILGRAAVVRAFLAFFRGDASGIIRYANYALEYLPEQDLTWRSTVAIVLGDAYRIKGDLEAAYRAQSEALETCKIVGDIYLVMLSSMKVAVILRMQGKLHETIEVCQQQMQLANEYGLSKTGMVGWILAVWGETLAEFNVLDEALQRAKKGVELFKSGGTLLQVTWSYMCLVRILFSNGDLASAEETIQKVENIGRESPVPPWIRAQVASWRMRLWLTQDKLEVASHWMKKRGLYADVESTGIQEIDHVGLIEYTTLARILIAQEQLDEATELLQRLLKVAEMGGRTSRTIEILILQALTKHSKGDIDQAVSTLEKALTLAEPEGFICAFIDEGLPMARLLYEASTREIAPDYIRQLLAVFPVTKPQKTELQKKRSPVSELVEPLSEREIEVLELIAEGLTNQEIASQLYLAPSTVKVHTRNIYGKLGVHHRTDAVAKARAFGILPTTELPG
jgi:LuxR family maltose regulon positive regulatory protein